MTNIHFYVSPKKGVDFRLDVAYRLVKIALERKLSIYIFTDSLETSTRIDDLLWRKEKTSFIPHTVLQDNDNEEQKNQFDKVRISHNHIPVDACDYLINLSNTRPDFFSRFLRVAEILDSSEEILSAGRKRYVFYRDRGYTLQYHQL